MRYFKALVLVLIFFLAMIFLFQNQASLSQTLSFKLDLLFMPAMTSIQLPFYFVLLAAFLLGALLCLLLLLWDRMRISAQIMRANFRVQAMQNEERKLISQMEKLAAQPKEGRLKLFFRKDKKNGEEASCDSEAKADAKASAEEAASPRTETDTFYTATPDTIDESQATNTSAKPAEAKG